MPLLGVAEHELHTLTSAERYSHFPGIFQSSVLVQHSFHMIPPPTALHCLMLQLCHPDGRLRLTQTYIHPQT